MTAVMTPWVDYDATPQTLPHEAAAPPSPMLVFRALNAYQQSAALKGAIELDIFTAIGQGARTAEEIAGRCAATPRGVRILCDYLVVAGFLGKRDGRYELTPDSATFLDRTSPAYIGAITGFLVSPITTARFADVAGAVRKGGTVAQDDALAPEHPVWVDFARSMAPLMAMPSQLIADVVQNAGLRPGKVLDIAAGHGVFGITMAQRNPQAQIVAVDWPNVLQVALENARAAGVDGRYRLLPGSAFDVDYGSGYDLVLLTNFLHHFDRATCEALLRKLRAALRDGGMVATLDFVPNEDRVSPPAAAEFSLTMLVGTPSGDAYTMRELDGMFRVAGFGQSSQHPGPDGSFSVVLSRK